MSTSSASPSGASPSSASLPVPTPTSQSASQSASTTVTTPAPTDHLVAESSRPSALAVTEIKVRISWPLILFFISVITTACSGARFMNNFAAGNPPLVEDGDLFPIFWALQHPARMLTGWEFSLTLLSILLAHEFGHYFACRAHKIRATLPYVLPAPTLSGTAGAVIRIQSRIPNRLALLDVGVSGPIAGYIIAVPAIVIGLLLSKPMEAGSAPAMVKFGEPLTIGLLESLLRIFHPGLAPFNHLVMHPVLVAGWVGLFITSLNLIPAGQLDGGHILYSISPKIHRYSTYAIIGILVIMGAMLWLGWFLWGAFLLLPAMQHPKVPLEPKLNKRRVVLAVVGLIILVLTLLPTPLHLVH